MGSFRIGENMNLSALYKKAESSNIEIDYFEMKSLIALSIPGAVALNTKSIGSHTEEKVILAHELGHHFRNSFYDISSTYELRERQEMRADRWAVENLVPLEELETAITQGHTELYDLAEYFDVTEAFMLNAINTYKVTEKLKIA